MRGFVFATADGWGLEIEMPLAGLVDPAEGVTFGVQVQANGSSGGDRDTKLSWSLADVGDTSFTDPSVFGTGVFSAVDAGATAVESSDPEPPPSDEPNTKTDVAVETGRRGSHRPGRRRDHRRPRRHDGRRTGRKPSAAHRRSRVGCIDTGRRTVVRAPPEGVGGKVDDGV